MNIIQITTENVINVFSYPETPYAEQMEELNKLIGPDCRFCERVMPRRLYQELGASSRGTGKAGSRVSMLVDEDGYCHDLGINAVGSYLYETDKHGCPIVGTILIVGDRCTLDRFEFCGISKQQFDAIYPKLKKLTDRAGKMRACERNEPVIYQC